MNDQTVLVVLSIAAALILNAVSNWIYDLLKRWGVFTPVPTARVVMIVALSSLPFILLIALPQIAARDRAALLGLLQTPLPLWVVLTCAALILFAGYLWSRKEIEKLNGLLEEQEKRSRDLEKQLNSERGPDYHLRPGDPRSQSRIIRPPK
jgi:hypothetical protein